MQNFKFFNTFKDYRSYVNEYVFGINEFKDHVYYRGLIEFVIRNRAPIFFELSHDVEFSHFTQYFNFVLDRKDYYKNEYVRCMYFTHDFLHMCFHNPLRPRDLTFDRFCRILNANEWVASNDTEIKTYYNIPGMREKSLEYPIMYDVLKSAGYNEMPSTEWLLTLRKNIMNGLNDFPIHKLRGSHKDTETVFAYLRKFKANNRKWCQLWYQKFPEINFPYTSERLYLPVIGYDEYLRNYRPDSSINEEKHYKQNVLLNAKTLFMMHPFRNEVPQRFEECEDMLREINGHVIMGDVAEEFHTQYIMNKKVGIGIK